MSDIQDTLFYFKGDRPTNVDQYPHRVQINYAFMSRPMVLACRNEDDARQIMEALSDGGVRVTMFLEPDMVESVLLNSPGQQTLGAQPLSVSSNSNGKGG